MRVAYIDCLSGVSGDMMLAALIDCGVSAERLQFAIDSLGLPECQLEIQEVRRHGFRAAKVNVRHDEQHAHRHLHHIVAMIEGSQLTARQQELATRIFQQIGEAEARVHGVSMEKVHFHEVGAVDSIADIVGAAVGWDLLQVDRIVCSPVPTGTGHIQIAHGRVSVPAPATAELLKGVPLAACDVAAELTTPTGAAIVTTIADQYGSLPAVTIEEIGYGAGDRELTEQPNIMRLVVGEVADWESDQAWVLETNLDDATGEVIGHCAAQLLEQGALDVYTTAVQMKKGRPGVMLSVLGLAADLDRLERIVFRETTTLGVRRWPVSRHRLARKPHSVTTPFGEIAGKVAVREGRASFSPEYEACRDAANRHGASVREVMEAARQAYASGQEG